jgi:alkanesulfonate monooxygenase SsuD/methylene tetrahydromethanopterin reductase-like flavin-dependent oxidoreductase (luciferase family)
VAAIPVSVTEDVDAGRNLFRGTAMMYWNLPYYRKEVLAAHPEALAGFDQGQPIPDAVVDEFAGIGSPDTVRAKIADYRDAGVTLPAIAVMPVPEGEEETLRIAAPTGA